MTKSDKTGSRLRNVRKWIIRIASVGSILVISAFLVAAVIILIVMNRGLPSLESLKDYKPKEMSIVYAHNGEVLGEFFNERRLVAHDIPDRIKNAFIAAEDSHFYTHQGVDFLGMVRAAYKNLVSGGIRQGASTITQQVARGFLLTSERTFDRKIREIILAWQIEKNLTKDEILHLYLNHIYLGNGAYGVKAAAQVYFGKDLPEVAIEEAAILGGLPQAPSRYSPYRNPDRVKRRQLYVLRQMRNVGFITEDEYMQATQADIYLEPLVDKNRVKAPYYLETVRQYVMGKYGAARILDGGMKIFTGIDLEMNRAAQNALRKGLSELEKRQGYRGPLRKLKPEEIKDYFKGRDFDERDDETVQANQELEVAVSDVKSAGRILIQRPKGLQVGDFLEGVVQRVDDEKKHALIEFAPQLFAQMNFDDLKWARRKLMTEDDEESFTVVTKVSDVVSVGDVVSVTVKAIPATSESLIEVQLEQTTEVEGAILAVNPHNGLVSSMVGGNDFEKSVFNRAWQAKRQPGSAFKPIVYAAALDYGMTAASLLQDSPITFENAADQERWRPANYDQRFVGDVTLRNSLLASRNITTIRLLNEVGLDLAMTYARRLGIESPLSRDFTLALGSSAVTLPEIIQPYIVFSNGGYRRSLVLVKKIVARDGEVLEDNIMEDISGTIIERISSSVTSLKKEVASVELSDLKNQRDSGAASFLKEGSSSNRKERSVVTSPLKPGQVLSTEASYLMSYLLKENVLYGTGRRAKELKRPASGKTGTTDENRDAWFIGFTPDLVAAVWVGYDDQRVLGRGETGSKAAVPIWLDFMLKATQNSPVTDFEAPDTIEFVRIDPKTGGIAPSHSKSFVHEAFVKGTSPTEEVKKRVGDIDLYEKDL